MNTGKLQAGIIIGLALLIAVGNSSADLWNLESQVYDSFARHKISIMHLGDIEFMEDIKSIEYSRFMKDSRLMWITCNNSGMNTWSLIAPFGNLGAIGSHVKAEIQLDTEVPEKLSDFTFTNEKDMNDFPEGNDLLKFKLLESEFDDLDSFISMNQRLSRVHNFTIRIYNKKDVRDMNVRLSTSGLSGILPAFHRRCKESQQGRTQ